MIPYLRRESNKWQLDQVVWWQHTISSRCYIVHPHVAYDQRGYREPLTHDTKDQSFCCETLYASTQCFTMLVCLSYMAPKEQLASPDFVFAMDSPKLPLTRTEESNPDDQSLLFFQRSDIPCCPLLSDQRPSFAPSRPENRFQPLVRRTQSLRRVWPCARPAGA